jgi:hypothetical protein
MVPDAVGSEAHALPGAPPPGGAHDQVVPPVDLFAPAPPPFDPGDASPLEGARFAAQHDDLPPGFKDSAGPAESHKTSVEASAQPAWSGASEVPEPAVETGVPEPVFFVPSYDEEVLPATSVAELTASALDAVLASEFGPRAGGTPTVTPPPDVQPVNGPRPSVTTSPPVETRPSQEPVFERVSVDVRSSTMAPTIEHSKVLDILLGMPRTTENAQSHTDTRIASGATASNASPAPSPVASESVIVMASPPPPAPAPPVFTDEAPPPPPPAPPTPPPVFTDVAPPPPPPVLTDNASSSSPVFTHEPDAFTAKPEGPSSPAFETEPALETEAARQAPSPVFVTQAPPPVAPVLASPPPPPTPPPAPMTPVGPGGFSLGEAPAPPAASPPLTAPPAPSAAAVFAAPPAHINGIEPIAAYEEEEDEAVFTSDPSHQLTSAASMATEILSATPEVEAVAAPEDETKSEFISQDVTLIARGRRKRFRLR